MTKPKIVRPPSPAARRVRSASLPFFGTLADDCRARLAALRDGLDALADDPRRSPNERAAEARRLLSDAKSWHARVAAEADRNLAGVVATAKRVAEAVRAVEFNLSPLELARMERQAAALAALPASERARDFERAFEARDLARLLAHGFGDALGDGGRKAVAVLVAQADYQALALDEGATVAQALAMREVGRGLAELAELEDPHAKVAVRGGELVDLGNRGIRSFADDEAIRQALPAADVAVWLRALCTPARTVVAEQAPQPADEPQAPAGGAA